MRGGLGRPLPKNEIKKNFDGRIPKLAINLEDQPLNQNGSRWQNFGSCFSTLLLIKKKDKKAYHIVS
jgi:hypothetical protein